MIAGCCGGRGPRRLFGIAAPVLPGVLLVLLPKCPLCLAAWLGVVMGAGWAESAVGWVREVLVVSWLVGVLGLVWGWRSNSWK